MMTRLTVLIMAIAMCLTLNAQDARNAEKLFTAGTYDKALEQYEQLLRTAPNNTLYQYRTARCMQQTGRYAAAIPLFEKSAARYTLAYYYLAICYRNCYRFEQALTAIEEYLATEPTEESRISHAETMRRECTIARHYMRRIADIAIIDSQQVSRETFLNCYRLSADAGTLAVSGNTASYTNQRGDQRIEARDGILWRSDRLIDGWEAPQSLPIDTMPSVNYPFLMPDGATLYFAAQGEKSMGGYDIFVTSYNNATDRYLTPENIGFPFNSPDNDFMLAIDENKGIGYWCTDRRQPAGKLMIYTFVPNAETQLVGPCSPDSMIQRASLTAPRIWRQDMTTRIKNDNKEHQNHKDSIMIEMADNIVYHHLNDFRSDSARHNYLILVDRQEELRTLRKRIEDMRERYHYASQAEKIMLKQAIINIENDIQQHLSETNRLLINIREQEKKMLKN